MIKIVKKGKLIAFFYRLLRDEIPAGCIEIIIKEISKNKDETYEYSNNMLADYAEDIVKRLLS